jgi:hypothetical protein
MVVANALTGAVIVEQPLPPKVTRVLPGLATVGPGLFRIVALYYRSST